MCKGSKTQGKKTAKKKTQYTQTQLTLFLHKPPFQEWSALQCDIIYYFSIRPQWLKYRNGEQECERQDYCEPNQEIEKCDRGGRLAERKSGGVWMKEILQGKKQIDGSVVGITE